MPVLSVSYVCLSDSAPVRAFPEDFFLLLCAEDPGFTGGKSGRQQTDQCKFCINVLGDVQIHSPAGCVFFFKYRFELFQIVRHEGLRITIYKYESALGNSVAFLILSKV